MMTLRTTARYRKDRNLCKKRGQNTALLDAAINILLDEKPLPAKYRDHELIGNLKGFRECHIQSDWLLIYTTDKGTLILTASRTGSHSDLLS
jgi:mRNA interferase YafQ